MNRQEWNGRRRSRQTRRKNLLTTVLLIASGALILIGVFNLTGSARDRKASEEADQEMRALYRAETTPPAEAVASGDAEDPAGITAAAETKAGTEVSGAAALPEQETPAPPAGTPEPEMPAETAPPVTGPLRRLAEQGYPGNPGRIVSTRFQPLRKQNPDIVGWLTIGSMVDEAVVRRDNEYYMDHNAKGDADVSGAIFLDELVSLQTRPYALILYGHNMKTGARFGSLRNFENPDFYHKYPFITFDTLYEDGNYVIFSVGVISTEENSARYLDMFDLCSNRTDERQRAIRTLQDVSRYSSTIDVREADQILLLVTCVERDEDRRIVAARRIRDDENRDELKALVEQSR